MADSTRPDPEMPTACAKCSVPAEVSTMDREGDGDLIVPVAHSDVSIRGRCHPPRWPHDGQAVLVRPAPPGPLGSMSSAPRRDPMPRRPCHR